MIVKGKGEEKNKILGIRMTEENLEEFDKFCKDHNLSKSEVARTAITKYLHIIYSPEKNPKLLYSKSQFRYCMDCLNEEQIQTLATITHTNGQNDMQQLEKYVDKSQIQDPTHQAIDYIFKTLVRFVFSTEGQEWFDEVSYRWENEKAIIFTGTHQLGSNFSQYIKELLLKYTAPHGSIQKEILTYEIVDEKSIFHVELHFTIGIPYEN